MTDLLSKVENQDIHTAEVTPPQANQRPSFSRGNDPIDRVPFIGHWLLSVLLVVAVPLVMLKLIEVAGLYALMGPLMLVSVVPGILLYVISARRRLVSMGARIGWLLLIVPFIFISLVNGYDGFMRGALPGQAMQPTLPPAASVLLLPAIILHVVLMVRRGNGAAVTDR